MQKTRVFLVSKYVIAASIMLSSPIFAQSPTSIEVLTNETLLMMLSAGLPEQAVIAKIKTSKTAFDLSTTKLIELKNKGVSGPVLAAMLEPDPVADVELSTDSSDPAVPHYPGIYMFGARSQTMTRMMPTASNQAKTGGIIGYALTVGIASVSIKATIPGAAARLRSASQRPVFYLFFDESLPRSAQNGANSIWTSGNGMVTSSPTELSLVRFMEKKEAREARVGSRNIGGMKSGVMDKDRISFSSELVRPGVFKVTPSADLPPGEYGFIQALTGGNVSGGGGALTARVFDIGVIL